MNVLGFDNPGTQYHYRSLVEGIRECGDRFDQIAAKHFRGLDELEESVIKFDADVCIFIGMNNGLRRYRDFIEDRGIATVILEQGHIGDRKIYPQLSYHDLNWITEFNMPWDRIRKLAREFRFEVPAPDTHFSNGKYILVLGQKEGDSQHPIEDMKTWAEEICSGIKKEHPFTKIVFRSHPYDSTMPEGFDEIHLTDSRELREDAIAGNCGGYFSLEKSLEGAIFCVTHNSNAGIKALLNGSQVISDPSAIYYGAGALNPEKFMDVFSRMAYSQWNISEMKSGEAWSFMKGHIKNNVKILSNN